MIPIVCIVGRSNSGKTTMLTKLIPQMRALGYRVAGVKHVPHGSDVDVPGKDSWRLLKAGSDRTFLSGPGQIAQFTETDGDTQLKELAPLAWDCDILLAEGYKDSPFPKIEVVREETGLDLLCKETQLAAVVSDSELPVSVRRFGSEEMGLLARFIAQVYVDPVRENLDTELVINDEPVNLNPFAKHFFARATLGMSGALKGIGRIRRLAMYVKDNARQDE